MDENAGSINRGSSSEAKIALFRSLFRGRDDVYPRRFESRKTGKSGYAPACANEWVRGICEKPRIKCAECPHRRFLPVTDDVIRWHLSGRDSDGQPFVAGVYPLLLDETCCILAVDFDKAAWRDDVSAFLDTCRRLDLPAALERSRSGRGAHVWFFFQRAIPAALARRLPRGCLDDIRQLLITEGVRPIIRDERHKGQPLDVTFQGLLRIEQQPAADAMLRHDIGVLAATTAFGKTVVAAWLIAERGVSALVLVHRRQLLDQWIERLSAFLGVPAKSIGRIGGGRNRPTGLIDVAIIQSLVRNGVVDDRIADYGYVIVDECHHVSAHSFEQVVQQSKARFVTGLSATVARKDGHHPIILMQCGPIRYRVNARAAAAARPFEHVVLVQPTAFQERRTPDLDKRVVFQALYQELTDDDVRTTSICDDVCESVGNGRSPLVLTERNEHLDRLEQGLASRIRHVVVLRAGMGRNQQRAIAERLATIPATEDRAILATGKYIGEGFDDPRLDTLFLTLPVSWRGTIGQYAGRLHRLHDGKREVHIYDYADLNVAMLARMFDRRCRGYEAIGYTIVLPASAIPGWPVDVVLPSDPLWKRDYSGSVRRLVRDGVDTPLARLFAHAARPVSSDASGADRARSATEAFLQTTGDAPRDQRAIQRQYRAADRVRSRRLARGRSPLRGRPCRGRGKWRSAPCRSNGVSPRPAQGSDAAGERLPSVAVPCCRRRQRTGYGARHHLEGAQSATKGSFNGWSPAAGARSALILRCENLGTTWNNSARTPGKRRKHGGPESKTSQPIASSAEAAKPPSPVQIRAAPPTFALISREGCPP